MGKNKPLINRAAVRDLAMATVAREVPHRADNITQVSDEFYTQIEAAVRTATTRVVRAHHVGKTLGKGN